MKTVRLRHCARDVIAQLVSYQLLTIIRVEYFVFNCVIVFLTVCTHVLNKFLLLWNSDLVSVA